MKKLLVLAVVLLSFSGYGQREGIEIDRGWATAINPYFEHLDKDRVPHGILLDYAMEFTDVAAFNGTLTDSTSINTNVYGDIYKTLLMGKVTADTTFFPKMEHVASTWASHRHNLNLENGTPVLVLSGLYYQYARLDKNAMENGRIEVENNQYHDVYDNGTWQNPYEELETVAYSLPVKNVRGGTFEVVLPEELFLTNHQGVPLQIEIDFDDGQGYQELTFGEHLPVSYNEDGVYQWKVRTVKEGDGQLLSSISVGISGTADLEEPETVFVPGPNSSSSLAKEGAWVHIDYAPGHNEQIKKPFIVAEGFDVGSILTPEVSGGERTLKDFQDDIETSGIQLRSLLEFPSSKQYDIIYIDWQNGTHDIKHNAEVLRNVINYINDQKVLSGSTKENVLLGQSMGGLVGRYALAKMEQDYDENHDVRLFIAHDSPMRGANTPISTQFFSRHVYDQYTGAPVLYGLSEFVIPTVLNFIQLMASDNLNVNFPSLDDVLTLQDTPAALQMNYHYVDISSDPTTAPHEVWQQEFDAMDYPEESINIAISNGSECAADQGFSPRDKIIDLHETEGFSFWGDLLNLITMPVIGDLSSDPDLVILGQLPGSSTYQYDFDMHTTPYANGVERRVYYGRIRYKKKLLWIGPTITHAIMDRGKNAPAGYLPYDTYSGGYYDIRNATDALPIGFAQNVFTNPRYGFIPVASSLDIRRDDDQELNHGDYLKKYSGGTVPHAGMTTGFDNFIVDFEDIGLVNNKHISFQARNGNWLANELEEGEPTTTDCSFICGTLEINGPSMLCSSATTFSVPPGAESYSWQVQNPGIVTVLSGTTTNSISLSQNGNENGWITLVVDIDGGSCGSASFEKEVYVGPPMVETLEDVSIAETGHTLPVSPVSNCDDFALKLTFEPSFSNVEDMEWEKVTTNYQWSHNMGVGNSNEYVVIAPECNGIIVFKVRMKNACGWSDWQELTYNVTQCGTNCSSGSSGGTIESDDFEIWPIPTSTNLYVKLKDTEPGLLQQGETLVIQLFNNSGVEVLNINAIGTQTTVDVSGLPSGIYNLILTYNGVPEGHQVSIN